MLPAFERSGICVDIETLGTRTTSVILSVGAVTWHLDSGIMSEFYVSFNPGLQNWRTSDQDTVIWWMEQQNQGLVRPDHESNSLLELTKFCEYAKATPGTVYSNGTDFDISILNNAFFDMGYVIPWAYNAVRDYRTLRQLYPHILAPVENKQKHHALEDARYEAQHLIQILRHIEGVR